MIKKIMVPKSWCRNHGAEIMVPGLESCVKSCGRGLNCELMTWVPGLEL